MWFNWVHRICIENSSQVNEMEPLNFGEEGSTITAMKQKVRHKCWTRTRNLVITHRLAPENGILREYWYTHDFLFILFIDGFYYNRRMVTKSSMTPSIFKSEMKSIFEQCRIGRFDPTSGQFVSRKLPADPQRLLKRELYSFYNLIIPEMSEWQEISTVLPHP